ncbi:MAG TPA: transglutaminase domain-containing protein [Nitrosomonas sp.]|nr:transglutaminase domain-containing protein [Nitrosomonas sp.]
MKRREFIKWVGMGATLLPTSTTILAQSLIPNKWRGYRLTYQITLPPQGKQAHLWLPLPDSIDTPRQLIQGSVWNGTTKAGKLFTLPKTDTNLFHAEWQGFSERTVTVSSIVKTADRKVDLRFYTPSAKSSYPENIKRFLQPTQHIVIDGAIRKLADSIIKKEEIRSPLNKARAIYDWVIDHSQFDKNIRGVGKGDIKQITINDPMLGKSADISALFVALARAVGIPARQQFGLRIDESAIHHDLGKLGDITTAQHCRAGFFLAELGWIPVDPAEVCEVIALENLAEQPEKIAALKERLFGSWEMNWIALNDDEDVSLSHGKLTTKLPFLIYPHALIDGEPIDSLNPNEFSYKITSALLVGTGGKF